MSYKKRNLCVFISRDISRTYFSLNNSRLGNIYHHHFLTILFKIGTTEAKKPTRYEDTALDEYRNTKGERWEGRIISWKETAF